MSTTIHTTVFRFCILVCTPGGHFGVESHSLVLFNEEEEGSDSSGVVVCRLWRWGRGWRLLYASGVTVLLPALEWWRYLWGWGKGWMLVSWPSTSTILPLCHVLRDSLLSRLICTDISVLLSRDSFTAPAPPQERSGMSSESASSRFVLGRS